MTQEQIKANADSKVKAIETLCRQMQVVVSAEQMVTKEGLIKNIIYYTDVERYELDVEPESNEKSITDIPPLREKDAPDSVRVRTGDVGSSEGEEPNANTGDSNPSGEHLNSGIKRKRFGKNRS